MSRISKALERSSWAVWFFPAIALFICAWLFYDYFQERAIDIDIYFDDASGIQAKKTPVRFRGVTVGMVQEISIAENQQDVIAHVTLKKEAASFAVDGSKFWLVLPKVGLQGVSGLETFFEGTYISVQPGHKGEPKLIFKGQIGKDANEPIDDTVPYILETPNAETVSVGDSVTFRGLRIGSVTKVSLSKTSQLVYVQINIQNKFMKVIRTNTVFWRKVGVQAKLGLFNSEIKINSLESILNGGIDLYTPDPPGPIAKAATHFALNPTAPKDIEKSNPVLGFNK